MNLTLLTEKATLEPTLPHYIFAKLYGVSIDDIVNQLENEDIDRLLDLIGETRVMDYFSSKYYSEQR